MRGMKALKLRNMHKKADLKNCFRTVTEEKTMMEHRITHKAQFTLVGVKRRFDPDTSYREIPKFWDELMEKGEERPIKGTFGVCIDTEGKEFDYWIADLYFPWEEIPEGCETIVMPEGLWAEFPCTLETLQDTNTRIWSDWLPALHGYSLAGGYDVEAYLPPEEGSDEMTISIWVPLKKDPAAGEEV
ncbi:MAG: GyrI-like domain-containing protein [Clostridia bacterium]|nr:GyrI-like domain-containing protein [Clostridia bacterium]